MEGYLLLKLLKKVYVGITILLDQYNTHEKTLFSVRDRPVKEFFAFQDIFLCPGKNQRHLLDNFGQDCFFDVFLFCYYIQNIVFRCIIMPR